MLEVKNLSVSYTGNTLALRDAEMTIPDGVAVCLLGANGAGKSTLLKTISGLLKPMTGEINFEGKRIHGLKPHVIVGKGIAHCPEGRKLFPKLTVLENLRLGAYTRKDNWEEDLEYVFTLFPRLRERAKQQAQSLSGGEQQMVAIGRSLLAKPKLLLLDEPSLGLSPKLAEEIYGAISQVKARGASVLIAEEKTALALEVADYAYVMQTGSIVLKGTSFEIKNSDSVIEAYLGA